jgi:hypothetical protein
VSRRRRRTLTSTRTSSARIAAPDATANHGDTQSQIAARTIRLGIHIRKITQGGNDIPWCIGRNRRDLEQSHRYLASLANSGPVQVPQPSPIAASIRVRSGPVAPTSSSSLRAKLSSDCRVIASSRCSVPTIAWPLASASSLASRSSSSTSQRVRSWLHHDASPNASAHGCRWTTR